MNDPGKLMELAVVFLVCPYLVPRREARDAEQRLNVAAIPLIAHRQEKAWSTMMRDSSMPEPLRQFFEVQSPVIELDIAQWLIHCHGVGERSPSSSSIACSVGLQGRSAESSH